MALAVGSRLGHYNVTALIGEGGMGQVYQARDTKLDRDVGAQGLTASLTKGVSHAYSRLGDVRD